MHTGFWCGNLRERDHLEDLREDIKMDIKEVGLLGMGFLAGSCECSNESMGSIKCGDFLD